MRLFSSVCVGLAGAAVLSSAAHAAITAQPYTPVGTATTFAATSANGAPLKFTTTVASNSNYNLSSGSSSAPAANGGIGEIFKGVSGSLKAITFALTGTGGGDGYSPFLYDLGTATFSDGNTGFNPATKTNLLPSGSATTLPLSPAANSVFYEIDLSGNDAATLDATHSYAFGFNNVNGVAGTLFRRSAGGNSDPNGEGFIISSPYSDPNAYANPAAFAGNGAPRALFVGVYTTPVTGTPEPAALSLAGLAGAGLVARRRRV